MDTMFQEKELMLDLMVTRQLLDGLSSSLQDGLDLCGISLLCFPSGNGLLITWRGDDAIPSRVYKQMAELAKVVHDQFGRTQIYLRHHQREMVMTWSSETLKRLDLSR